MTIPIVFSTDKNYIFYTCVAITSLARHAAPGTKYDIFILTGEIFSGYDLLKKAETHFPNTKIHFLPVDTVFFRSAVINNSHVTEATFYRLVLCRLLDVDKCIYLDSDILVTDDLQALYQTELEGYYMAGCRDLWIDMLSDQKVEERRIRTRIPSMAEYVNAGVLVMNLEKIRADGLDKMFLQHMDMDYPYEDQDILNVCCYGKIRHLPARWNIFTLFLGQLNTLRQNGIRRDILASFQERRGIIHYATPYIRPWEHSRYWANTEWWEVAAEWRAEPCWQELQEKICMREKQERWEYWLERCRDYKRIVIFGFTIHGRNLCEWLLRADLGEKLLFCDNDLHKQEYCYQGIRVVPLESVIPDHTLFLNSSQGRQEEVRQILLGHGVREGDILSYKKEKQEGYYRYLDSRYYLDELKDIFLREFGYGLGEFTEDLALMRKLLSTDFLYRDWYEKYHLEEWILNENEG